MVPLDLIDLYGSLNMIGYLNLYETKSIKNPNRSKSLYHEQKSWFIILIKIFRLKQMT